MSDNTPTTPPQETTTRQRLHLVMGGRVKDPRSVEFQDPESIHVVGVFSSYELAEEAWRSNAQRTVDDAEMKYVIVHIHKLLEPTA
ncbi:MAG: DUF4170 domain-containing protein [Erythrobacter sp.]|nr:DUF4170 domain-containing protein [Erythrobacter sp.]NCQ63821.1 DUF4170 domain-containing protein [Alphaproteobacteria bacterium]